MDQNYIYKLKEQVNYLRQLVKYKSGSTFIDSNGEIIKYKKSSKLFKITSHKIIKIKPYGVWSIIYIKDMEIPFIIGQTLEDKTKYASIMHTNWGPFLYDLTVEKHDTYKRKI